MNGKLFALGVAQDMLLREDHEAVDLETLVQTTLSPFMKNSNFVLHPGSRVFVDARHISGLTLALYELSTNALKYGGLGAPDGSVHLSWSSDANKNHLEWRESGRLTNEAPGSGYGNTLIKSAFSAADDHFVVHEITEEGVRCTFEWPTPTLRSLEQGDDAANFG